jgi:serine protease Do
VHTIMDEKDIQQKDAVKNTTQSDESQVYTAADRDFAFNGNASPDGNGYKTPTGGHGYVYAPPTGTPSGSGKGKKAAMIALIAVLASLLVVSCVMLGTVLAHYAVGGTEDSTDAAESDRETGGGMFIVVDPNETSTSAGGKKSDETEPSEKTDEESSRTEADAVSSESSETTVIQPSHTIPDNATISKKSALRKDADGDGKADTVLDADGNVLTSADTNTLSAATVVYRVADSVVEITTETIVRSNVIGQYVTSGAGSGVIISADGFVITNNHVISDADSIVVTLTDGTQYSATLIGTDEESDIALLWIDAEGKELTVATMGSSFDLVVGEDVIAIGNPLGSLGGTVTEGIISATAREISIDGTDMTLLQISAPINPGNSGGGLFNMAGELVGIVNAKCSSEDVEGLGFAIPIDTAYDIVCELYRYGYVRGRVTTGLSLVDVSSANLALRYFNSMYTGVYVYESTLTDELKTGDLILSFDGTEVTTSSEIKTLLEGKKVGDTVEVVVYRSSSGRHWEQVTVNLTLGEKQPTQESDKAA